MRATELLRRDHRNLEHLLAVYASAPRRPRSAKVSLFEQLERAIVLHDAVEDQRFFPAVERLGGRGVGLAESKQQHRAIRSLLLELRQNERLPPFDALMRELDRLVRRHVREEEDQILAALDESLDPDALEHLGQGLAAHKARLAEGMRCATNGAPG